jgi:tellurite resistance protein TerC
MPDPVQLWHWIAFAVFVAAMLLLDLGVFHRKSHEPTLRQSAIGTVIWCTLALAFNALIWWWLGSQAGTEFLTGYLIEWSLSMDNVFVFAVIFGFFRVPLKYQYRVLFWGILGAVVMRLTFVLAGAELLARFEWMMVIFGGLLVYSGVQLALHGDKEMEPEKNIVFRLAKRLFPLAKGDHGDHFLVREEGRLCITPLFLVLLVVESTDVIFAVDSVPAIFGVVDTTKAYSTFIVFTSNVFAILGLRALYFLLAGVMDMFRYLKYGLSAVLVFVGSKMLLEWASHRFEPVRDFFGVEEGHHLIPAWISLVTVVGLLALSIGASLIAERRDGAHRPKDAGSDPTSEN